MYNLTTFDLPSPVSGTCSSWVAKDIDLTITKFLPGTERDLDILA